MKPQVTDLRPSFLGPVVARSSLCLPGRVSGRCSARLDEWLADHGPGLGGRAPRLAAVRQGPEARRRRPSPWRMMA